MSSPPQKLFLICGLSRLSARVARSLVRQGYAVSVIAYDGDKSSLRMILPPSAQVFNATAENAAETLAEAGIERAECMLALSEDDMANVRSTVSARSIVAEVPVVMRAFDPLLADHFEKSFGVRRAYSVSSLAAPAFIAAAAGAEMMGSLRLGGDVVPFCRIKVPPQSPLIGKTLDEVESEQGVTVIASRLAPRPNGKSEDACWQQYQSGAGEAEDIDQGKRGRSQSHSARHAFGGGRLGAVAAATAAPQGALREGDELCFGGTTRLSLAACIYAAGWYKRKVGAAEVHGRGSAVASARPKKRKVSGARRSQTFMPLIIAALLLFAVFATVIFANTMHLNAVNAVYFTATTVMTIGDGDVDMAHFAPWLRLFQLVVLLSGWILLGVSLSYLTSLATAERLEVTMARQAERMSQHLIIIGLGNVGFRISEALAALGLDTVVVDLAPPPAFYDSVARRAPVIAGDARQSDFLSRIAITEAEAIIACTSNDVANVEVCLHARRMNPKIRTVARVFDNKIVGTVASAFHIDRVLSATSIAESAFVIAASDADALLRLPLGGEEGHAHWNDEEAHEPCLNLVAARYCARTRIVPADIRYWRSVGINLLAFRSEKDHAATASLNPDEVTFETVALGAEPVIRELLAGRVVPKG